MDYTKITESDFFKNTYSQIENLKKDFPVNHGFVHIYHVIENGKHIAKVFGLDDKQTNQLLVACALHDIGYIKGRHDHAKNGGEFSRDVLKNFGFNQFDVEVISNAISNHGGDDESCYKDAISRCLVLSDKLDFIKSRYKFWENYNYGTMAYFHIEKTFLSFENKKLILHIVHDGWENIQEFMQGSFCQKLKTCLDLASKSLNATYDIVLEKIYT